MSIPTPTEAKRTYLGIQALRAVAALLVVSAHAWGSWNERILQDAHAVVWFNNQSGVDIFFVISGFVMAVTAPGLANYPNKARVFLWRRCVRIVPLYWIFTTLKIVRLKFGPMVGEQSVGSAWHIIASYLFIPTKLGEVIMPLLAVGWTLNYEMLFYYLFTIALALEIPLLPFLTLALGVTATIGSFYQDSWPTFTILSSPLVLEFLFGVYLAHFTLNRRLPGKVVGVLLLVGGFVAILWIPLPPDYSYREFRWGLPALAIVTGVVVLEDYLARRWPKWLLEAGNASYAIYLVHLFVISPIWFVLLHLRARGIIGAVTMVGSAIVLSLLVGIVVHRVIELPIVTFFRGSRVRGVSVPA